MLNDTEQDIKAEIVVNASGEGTRLAHRDKKSGMFARRPKPMTPERIRAATSVKLTQPLDETGRTHFEEVLDAQLEIAKRTDVENCGTSPTKAAEFLAKVGGMLEKPTEKPQSYTIIITSPDVPFDGEWVAPHDRPQLKQPPWVDSEVVSTNPPLLFDESTRR